MSRVWISSESRKNLRHRQHLAELDAQNGRPRKLGKMDYQRQQQEERLRGLRELARQKDPT